MTDETQPAIGFEEAARRLDHALSRLEVRMNALAGQAEQANGGLFDQDRAHLASELDASRARERELEAASQAASQALDHAIAGVRAALGD
ncbi:MAG TPA: DUF4164 family protein [Caulobacteraceae bacterium]|jgi:predicted  nucleic acid-binding Zn-ribbon protein|nr:DUF4164 family protein [Caulobacteraceae bacterium]